MPKAYAAVALGLTFGAIFWSPSWAIVGGLMAVFVYHAHKLQQLDTWLKSDDRFAELPDSQGVWGRVFDRMEELQLKHFKSQQELTTSILRIQKSANALREGVVTVDANGALEWWNTSARKMLGLKKKQDRGAPLLHLLREPSFFRYYHHADFSQPIYIQSPVNPEQVLEVAVTAFAKGDNLLILRDMTDSIKLENMRRDFTGNVSHELRTPLTVIQGYLESFQLHHPELDTDVQKGHARMLAHTHRMTNLVQDLLVLSRLEESIDHSKMVQLQMPPLLTLALSQGQELSQRLDKKVTINSAIKSQNNVLGIKAEILSVLTHLVNNAVKYTPHGGRIAVTYQVTDGQLCLSVADNGIGIGAQHLPRLTERFYRVDASRSSASGGTGLGLAIVNRIIERHKGSLDIISEEGQGSCFTCTFPL
ncbi:MAG: phosphate regulon sensor histidine kinase PhoR [Oceanospirillaceae bacterium]|nr:phosphate regulon sensor histidine kinase PhoR [Oceanospirillaceae bacterium]MDO7573899.1 phosphate regulon sensor histidine kinase PhoR [Oceanospirillaceae bacterium]MDO7584831.1 phosphate regulon sensor histidine kinase PhoR [Oceanospirillaceae bacterium]